MGSKPRLVSDREERRGERRRARAAHARTLEPSRTGEREERRGEENKGARSEGRRASVGPRPWMSRAYE